MSVAAAELEIENPEILTGNFEADYYHICKKFNVRPLRILKFGPLLPPLPIKEADLSSTRISGYQIASDEKQSGQSKRSIASPCRKFVSEKREAMIQDFLKKTNQDYPSSTKPWTRTSSPYISRYKFTATIDIEPKDGDDSLDSLYKLEIRGYKLSLAMSDVFNTISNSMNNLVEINLYNCRLNEQHISFINNLMVLGSLRIVSIDRNPLVPEAAHASLLAEWSCIRLLSLRGNNIGNIGAKAIALALKSNRILVSLDLFGNKIQKYGAAGLAEALKDNNVLQSLNLGKNCLGDGGVSVLTEAYKRLTVDLPKDKKTGNKANAVPSVKKVPETQPKTSGSAQIKEAKKSSTNNTAEEKKPKKVGTPKGKKTLKDEDEQSANSMFEINNRFYIQGNRTLNNLNLCGNSITEYGLQILLNVTLEQDVCAENGNEIGLFKIPLQVFPE